MSTVAEPPKLSRRAARLRRVALRQMAEHRSSRSTFAPNYNTDQGTFEQSTNLAFIESANHARGFSGGNLIAGGGFNSPYAHIATKDKITGAWSQLGAGLNGTPRVAAKFGKKLAIAGSGFTVAGGTCANITLWDGSTFNPIGTGISYSGGGANGIYAMCSVGSSPNTILYVGGKFDTVNGVTIYNLAAYSEATGLWTNIGTDGEVYHLKTVGSTVYAMGAFQTIGGTSINRKAFGSIGSWSVLGGTIGPIGTSPFCTHIGFYGGIPIVIFHSTDAPPRIDGNTAAFQAQDIAQLTGSTFAKLDAANLGISAYTPYNSTNGGSDRMVEHSGKLWFTGSMQFAGGLTVNYFCTWDGTNFATVGAGLSGGTPSGICLYYWQKKFYIGGTFTSPGSNLCTYDDVASAYASTISFNGSVNLLTEF